MTSGHVVELVTI